jgi:hypothetical protein
MSLLQSPSDRLRSLFRKEQINIANDIHRSSVLVPELLLRSA